MELWCFGVDGDTLERAIASSTKLSHPSQCLSGESCFTCIHMWQTQVENEHYSTLSGLIQVQVAQKFLRNKKAM